MRIIFTMSLLFVLAAFNSQAQLCPLINNNGGTVTPGCGAFGTALSLPSTSYGSFTAISGVSYTVSTCGTTWDSQITGFDGSNAYISGFENDDNGSACSGLQASLDWTATYSGTVKAYVTEWSCGSNWTGTSAILSVRQNTTITNTTSQVQMCGDGSTKSLTANYGGAFSGSPTITWSIVSGPGSIAGTTYTASGVSGNSQTVTIRATLGVCSSDVSFTVYGVPTTANAGSDQTQCDNGSFTLAGNSATVGSGVWSLAGGSASITTPSSPSSGVTGIASSSNAILRWTISNGSCPSSSDDVTLFNNLGATVNAGGPDVVCQSSTPGLITLSGATIGGSASTGAWSILSGGGTLSSTAPSATPATRTYRPAANFSGTAVLQLITDDPDGAGPCTTVTSTRNIVVNPEATVTAGGPDIICQLSTPSPLTLSGSSIGGAATTGTWSILSGGGSLSSTAPTGTPATITYTPAANFSGSVTLQLTTNDPDVAGPCVAVSATRTITINPQALVSAGGPDVVCQSATPSAITLSGSSIGGAATSAAWSILSGGGSLSNTSATANPEMVTYTPAANFSGTVTLQLQTNDPDGAGPCIAETATRTITVGPQPTVDAGGPDAVCQSSSPGAITLAGAVLGGSATAGTWSIVSGGGTLSSTSPTANPELETYTPAPNFNGTVTLQLTTDAPPSCVAATDTRTIVVNELPAVAPTNNSPVCVGDQINLNANASGGLPAYTYSWSGPSSFVSASPSPSLANATSAMGGNYDVTVTDQNTCSSSGTTLVVISPLPNGNISGSITVCSGISDTTLTLNFSVGIGPFDVSFTDGGNTFSRTGVNDGDTIHVGVTGTVTYTFSQIQDANGCIRTSGFLGGATITVAPLPVITTASVTDALCNGGNTGTITVSASTGTPPYTYSIDSGLTYQGNNLFTGLTAGSYNLAVADALNCSSAYASNPVVVGEPPVLDHTYVVEDASCANVFDGKITVTPSGGVAPYTYSVNGGPSQSGNVLSGLSGGTYILQIEDFNGCTDTSHVLVNNTYAVTGSIVSQTDVSCFGGVDGTVTLDLTGGVPPYSYSINGVIFQPSPSFTGLAAGNYVATLRDSKECTDFANVTIAQPALLQAQLDSTQNILCSGNSSGAIYISVSGGNGGYSFLWSNSDTTEDISGLSAGTYNVAITDSKGCSASTGATITEPLPLFLSIASYRDLACNSDSSGEVDITVNGGVPPYIFTWSNGATSEDILNLPAATYYVTVTDVNGCLDSLNQTLTEPTSLTTSITSASVLCAGGGGGSVDLTVNGGTPNYNYLWSNGATTEDLTNVSGGTYSVIIHDANGCSISDVTTVVVPTQIVLSLSVTNVLCNGDSTGALDLTVTGGTSGYTYAWSNGATTEDLSAIPAGNYAVTVTDANSCTASASAAVTQPAAMVLNATTTVGCAGTNNGSIDITVQGGVFPYSYLWSTTATTEDVNGLSGGTYSVTVTDANACTLTQSFTITSTVPMTTSIVGTDVTCNGAANGSADLTVTGGSTPYTFLWSTFNSTEDISNLSGGTYFVIVTDANGCEARDSVVIAEGAVLTLTVAVTNVSCNGDSTGAIDLTVTGGAGGYVYSWSNTETTEDISALAAGNYSVTVTDANSCSATTDANITQPPAIALSGSVTDVQCVGNNDGSIFLAINGGTPLYTFLWSNTATTQNILNLSPGGYSVTVTDANACTATASFTINAPASGITSTVTGTNVLCFGANTGTATVVASGGSLPYTYLWSNFQATATINGLDGGIYYVMITDANGCTHRDSVIIDEPSQLILAISATNISCFNVNDGSIDLTVTGATPAYTYVWTNTDTTQDISGLAGGTYTVTVTDDNSCTASISATIVNPSDITSNFVVHDPLCNGDLNGSIDLIPTGGTPNYSFIWNTTDTTEDISSLGAGTYTFTITDSRGCVESDSVVVTEPSPFYVSGVIKHVTCFGDNDGQIDATAYGGTLPYSFTWSTGQSTEDLWNLPGGSDTVYAFDANGCAAVSIYVINEPGPLTVNIATTNVNCFGGSNGTLAAIPSGGVTPYMYLWDDLIGDSARANMSAGKYAVLLTDSNGCIALDSAVITEPFDITITAAITDAACNGANNGAIDITVSGGTPGYAYAWTGGASTEDLTNLFAGVYVVTVTDTNSCVKSASFEIKEATVLSTSVSLNHPICHGGNTGFILLDATGGVPPYTYTWNTPTPNAGPTAGNLDAGTYTVTVADTRNCSATVTAELIDPAEIIVNANTQGANCSGAAAVVTATVSGGLSPYTYLLNGVARDTGLFFNLPAGDYLLLVMDVNGCQGTTSFNVGSVAGLDLNVSATQQVILTGMETQLVVSTDSNISILHYSWMPDTLFTQSSCTDCSNPFVAPRTTTMFSVTVMTSDSCYVTDTITIYVNNEASKFIPTAFTPNGDGLNDRFEFDILGAERLEVNVFNRWGHRVYFNENQTNGTNSGNGWDGTIDGKPATFDTYVYQIKVTYWDGVAKSVAGTVTLMK